ncbi:MAG: hypothetical protein GF370_00915 [Candidatus Nealsonbacteria bacterium]|nr:hypothetical protein [Candidatus Nealsonbacteria bacterium]
MTKFHNILGNERIKKIVQGHGLGPEAKALLEEFLKELDAHPMELREEERLLFDKILANPQKQRIITALLEINSEYGKEKLKGAKTPKSI